MSKLPAERSVSRLATPLSDRGVPVWLIYPLSLTGLGYLLNPTSGVFELLPDILPVVGHLDEGTAFILVWYGLLEFMTRRRRKKEAQSAEAASAN